MTQSQVLSYEKYIHILWVGTVKSKGNAYFFVRLKQRAVPCEALKFCFFILLYAHVEM